ncbi:Hypothetical protein HVR_LOCUS595 [uncultured virus]|nr:Hypothetical protein HVR_LOCUS595 [uncultured virus]
MRARDDINDVESNTNKIEDKSLVEYNSMNTSQNKAEILTMKSNQSLSQITMSRMVGESADKLPSIPATRCNEVTSTFEIEPSSIHRGIFDTKAESLIPVHFYFPIMRGEIIYPLTNFSNGQNDNSNELIEKFDRFDIRFKIKAFVDIQVKLITPSPATGWLFRFPDSMLDSQNGPCINLRWIGLVNKDDRFILSGPIDVCTNGYWFITIL